MKVSDVMSKDPACCVSADSASKAAEIMRQLNVGIVPVVDSGKSGKLLGVVTDRDVCVRVVADGKDPKHVKVSDCMTSKVVTCTSEDDLETVMHLMQQNQVRRIPVVGAGNRVEGIVSTADLVLCGDLEAAEVDETMRDICEPNYEEFEQLTHVHNKQRKH